MKWKRLLVMAAIALGAILVAGGIYNHFHRKPNCPYYIVPPDQTITKGSSEYWLLTAILSESDIPKCWKVVPR